MKLLWLRFKISEFMTNWGLLVMQERLKADTWLPTKKDENTEWRKLIYIEQAEMIITWSLIFMYLFNLFINEFI